MSQSHCSFCQGPSALGHPQMRLPACSAILIMLLFGSGESPILASRPCHAQTTGPAETAASNTDLEAGRRIYQELCAACHGQTGEGTVDHYNRVLTGDRSVRALARVIAETMPEGEAERCQGKEAELVAAYIHSDFYSPVANARLRPPRIELQHLTVSQYRSAVADVIGSFGAWSKVGVERGLNAEYFDERRFRGDKRVIQRIDPVVNFDYAEGSPGEGIKSEEFSAKWNGSLIIEESGTYEFIVSTHNGARLWINDKQMPLIDAWVRSGDDIEYRATTELLAGRVYPLRLEFFKFKEKQASIRLLWKRPRHSVEPIPERNLAPADSSGWWVVSTPFPPDDESYGYARGVSVSKEWDQATTLAAVSTAEFVIASLDQLARTKAGADDYRLKVRDFCVALAGRAFRRPLSAEEQQLYVDRQLENSPDVATAVRRIVLLVMKSPRFLFHTAATSESMSPSSYRIAEHLSFALWDSIPDESLWQAAARNELTTREQIEQQARRMAADDRATARLQTFLLRWLNADKVEDLSKDGDLFPAFNADVLSDLRTSLNLSLLEIIQDDRCDFRRLLTDDGLYVNSRLADFYNVAHGDSATSPAGPFQRVAFEPDDRSGVLSHPFLMTGFAYYSTSSPIHRGVFIARNLLGRTLNPPAEAVTPLPPDLHPDLTTRERVILQTKPDACSVCHELINPLGFALERFDAVGRLRVEEKSKPIDSAGHYDTLAGETVPFSGANELGEFLASSEEVHLAFCQKLFAHLVKQPPRAYGFDTPEQLRSSFVNNDFNMRRLMVAIAVQAAMRSVPE